MRFLLFLFLFLCNSVLSAQSKLTQTLSGEYSSATLLDVLTGLEQQYKIRLCVEPEKLPWYKVSFRYENLTIHETLTQLLTKHGLVYATLNDSMLGICPKNDLNAKYLKELRARCISNTIEQPEFLKPYQMTISTGTPGGASKNIQLDIFVQDNETGESVPSANIQVDGKNIGLYTNEVGKCNLKLVSGSHQVLVQYVGYRNTEVQLDGWESGDIKIVLKGNPLLLQEVQISGNKAENKLKTAQTAVEVLSIQAIKDLPAFMGEADVVKSLTTLAGVTSAGEGSSGFNVRGGNIDQNLTLQDNALLFNTSHVLGLFSVYNPDVVQNVTLYKGHIPSRFGGRVSSVLDVKLKDGDFSNWHGSIGIGLINGKIMLEGPIIKNRLSIIGGFRRSYAGAVLSQVQIPATRDSRVWFGDGILKMSARIGARSSFSVSAFQTNDFLQYKKSFGYGWKNQILNTSLKTPIGDRLISIVQGNYGRYSGNYFVPSGVSAFDLNNGLNYMNAGYRLVYTPNQHQEINVGLQWDRIIGQQEKVQPRGSSSAVLTQAVAKDRGETYAFFIEDDLSIGSRWSVSAGLRIPYYRQFGPKTVYNYLENAPRITENIVDSTYYGPGSTIFGTLAFEPRASVKYQLNAANAFKFSYNRINQFTHLISNLTAPTPVDIWQVSTRNIRPQQGDSYDVGYTTEWKNRKYEFTTDVFYRTIQSVPVYRNLPQLLLNEHIETEVLPGNNRSYGLETSFHQKKGILTGWLTYTYSRSLVSVNSLYPQDIINNGQAFRSDYDQPHQINAFLKFSPIPSFFIAINYVYRTGRPVTAPTSVYQVGTVIVPDYSQRNNLRIPDYHRVDVSMNLDQNKSKISGVKTSFSISIYNVLFRDNPYTVFFAKRPGEPTSAYSLSLVGAAIPAANLIFTF